MQRYRPATLLQQRALFRGFSTGYTALLGGLTDTGRSAVNVLSFCASTPIKTFSCRSRIWACGSTS